MSRKSGYKLIRSRLIKDRLPSSSTTARRISHIKANTGIQKEIFNCISINPKCKAHHDNMFIMDEMSIEPRIEYFSHVKALTGFTTLAQNKPQFVASNLVLFQVSGILCNNKYEVVYLLTGDTIDSMYLNLFFLELLEELTKFCLQVRKVASDMGRNNSKFCQIKKYLLTELLKSHPYHLLLILL